jgi:ABC-type uncharacterized transport system substrate-binding protein
MRFHISLPARRGAQLLVLCCAALAFSTADAQFTLSDVQIAGRALGFLDKPLQGQVTAGIVYSPANPQSAREAEALKDMLGDGLKIGNITLRPVLISVADVQHSTAALFLLTDGLDDVSLVADASRNRKIPCITTDLRKVKDGHCAIGVSSQPKIEILVNRNAAIASQLSFSAVFRMMITEI